MFYTNVRFVTIPFSEEKKYRNTANMNRNVYLKARLKIQTELVTVESPSNRVHCDCDVKTTTRRKPIAYSHLFVMRGEKDRFKRR